MKAKSDNIIIKVIEEKVSDIIYIPPIFREKLKALRKGIVVSAGPGIDDMKMPVTTGNTVVFGKYNGYPVEHNHVKLHVIKLHHLICAK